MLSDSSTFLRFWLKDACRETLLSCLPKPDLASLRLVCHDFSVRAAPALFEDLSITFRSNSFTKPAKLAALDRLGFYVKTLEVRLPHTPETFLPPLVIPETGEELSFTYTPQIESPSIRRPKYGDEGTTEILTRQYPPLFHAATNVSAWTRAFSAFINLEHLKVTCPGFDASRPYRRSTVDYALISLRIAVERACLSALDTLTLAPLHSAGIMYLSPLLGYGATPNSARRWSRVNHLAIEVQAPSSSTKAEGQPDTFRLLQTYLANFQCNLRTFDFRWVGAKGPFPFAHTRPSIIEANQHPALQSAKRKHHSRALHFPYIEEINISNVSARASDVSSFLLAHKSTIEELDLQEFELTDGNWEEAFAPLETPQPTPQTPNTPRALHPVSTDMADIPIMLSPTTASPASSRSGTSLRSLKANLRPVQSTQALSRRIEKAAPPTSTSTGERRSSRWVSKTVRKPSAARKMRDGLADFGDELRRVFKGFGGGGGRL